MSALLAPDPKTRRPRESAQERRRPLLRPLATPSRRMARLPFLVVLIGAFGIGMAGLLMLNTTLQGQAFEARALNRQATQLTYVQADLEGQLDAAAAPGALARQASALGMRANPYPAFLVVPSGKVVGKAKPVKGDELSELIVKTPAQLAAEQRAAEARGVADAAQRVSAQLKIAAQQRAKAAQDAADAAQAKADAAKKKAAAAQNPTVTRGN